MSKTKFFCFYVLCFYVSAYDILSFIGTGKSVVVRAAWKTTVSEKSK